MGETGREMGELFLFVHPLPSPDNVSVLTLSRNNSLYCRINLPLYSPLHKQQPSLYPRLYPQHSIVCSVLCFVSAFHDG